MLAIQEHTMAKVDEPSLQDISTDPVEQVVPQKAAVQIQQANPRSTPARSSTTLSKARQTFARPFKRSKFHRFRELPAELRLQIWQAACEPRVHELHPCAKLYDDRMTFRSNSCRTPNIFHVCHESRMVAMSNYELMEFTPPNTTSGKGILRFYFSPKLDTLLLNSLMGLFIMFMLLEEEEDGAGVMKGWERVAFDAERAQLISLLSGIAGHSPQPRFKSVFPSLRELIIADDSTSKGKTRFRTSVWPGENGTTLKEIEMPDRLHELGLEDDTFIEDEAHRERHINLLRPMAAYLRHDYGEEVPVINLAKVKRKTYIRGDIRYVFRKSCSLLGLRPRGVFRRL